VHVRAGQISSRLATLPTDLSILSNARSGAEGRRWCALATGSLRGYHGPPITPDRSPSMRTIITGLAVAAFAFGGARALAADAATQEANKKAVVEFYEKGLNQKDFEAASKYVGQRYVQHNPTAPDGLDGFKAFLRFLREKFPDSHSEIKQVFADGDYVILHVHAVREKGSRGRAIVDIFKLEAGKIVEHWDVAQDIPEKSANTNGMF
jgi:predicted SnoaL-like aldol condensation-catalyzing enzyme